MTIYATNDRKVSLRTGLWGKIILTVLQGGRYTDAKLRDLTYTELYHRIQEVKYDELLLAVHSKFPDVSRHETALRYIREKEKNIHEGKTIDNHNQTNTI